MAEDLETWKNPTEGRVWVNRLDHRGELTRTEIIGSGRTFHLTAAERRLNQEMAVNPDLDIFSNGTLTPVRLIGTDDAEAAAFASNPNLMTEGDMRTLVARPKGKATDQFNERLATIRNPATLERLLSLAREEDAPLSRVEAIQGRLAEVSSTPMPSERVVTTALPSNTDATEPSSAGKRSRMPASRAVTPN
jgi:hypothetical protein